MQPTMHWAHSRGQSICCCFSENRRAHWICWMQLLAVHPTHRVFSPDTESPIRTMATRTCTTLPRFWKSKWCVWMCVCGEQFGPTFSAFSTFRLCIFQLPSYSTRTSLSRFCPHNGHHIERPLCQFKVNSMSWCWSMRVWHLFYSSVSIEGSCVRKTGSHVGLSANVWSSICCG